MAQPSTPQNAPAPAQATGTSTSSATTAAASETVAEVAPAPTVKRRQARYDAEMKRRALAAKPARVAPPKK